MKEYINNKYNDLLLSIKNPTSNKMNQNSSLLMNNCFTEKEIIIPKIPDIITDKYKEAIISTNKLYFYRFEKKIVENNLLKLRLKELINKKKEYRNYLNNLLSKQNKNGNTNLNKAQFNNDLTNIPNNFYISRKRKRRKKSQIICKYKCSYTNCNKKYSTEGCLNQHMKLKHSHN